MSESSGSAENDDSAGSGRSGNRIPDEALLADLRRVAEEVDGSPSMADADERGAFSPSTYQSRFGSWTDAKEAAGVPVDAGGVTYTDDELLEDLLAFADELGETPTRAQMRTDGPRAPSTYADRFGSWTDALAEAGLDTREHATGIPEAELLSELRRVTEEVGRCPTSEEFDERGRYSAATYFRRYDSWAAALDRAGVSESYPLPSRRQVSDNDLVAELDRLASALGRPPTETEMSELGEHSPKTYRRRFGSWEAALVAADLDLDRRVTGGGKRRIPTAKLVADVHRVAEERGRPPTVAEIREDGEYAVTTYLDRFGSWNCALDAAGLEPRRSRRDAIPTRELVRELRQMATRLGRRPRRADMDDCGPYAGMTYYNRFGSWDEALDAAGIRTDDGRTFVEGRCDVCAAAVREPVSDLPDDEGLFCSEACRAVGRRRSVAFESDVLDAAEGDGLGRLAAALSESDEVVPAEVLFCLRHALALFDGEFESARVDDYDVVRDGDAVTVSRETGPGTGAGSRPELESGSESGTRELRIGVETLDALQRRMADLGVEQVEAAGDRWRESATDD
ncbi:homing endonuclease associated repeat-containing protein [Halorussus litoreus]|uniref:homing endonuclease associated repeat-containing protein n=1 Tax=Halorussus litoreus TaxID=1710536 RepID=UPI000E23595F|nr:hypothetical protein [Halorussus litoreus]